MRKMSLFVSEEIKKEEDKCFFESIALPSMTGRSLVPGWWTIDRKNKVILYERGGGAFEIPVGYGLYIDGNNVKIEVVEQAKGSRYENNLVIFYFIKKIEIPSGLVSQGYTIEDVINIIKEAFVAMGVPNVEREKILEINIRIMADPVII